MPAVATSATETASGAPASTVFLTGGGGFIGSRVLARLAAAGHPVIALDRSGAITSPPGGVRVVRGDLLDPPSYRSALAGAAVVVHLAAATGKASAAEHMRANAEATETLIAECRATGRPAPRFIFISSIATTFADTRDYPYAQAKARAEAAVRASGLEFSILRPTMVLGPGSPIQAALETLASLPVMPVFGDGLVRVQPIQVDEVADRIAAEASRESLAHETRTLGGPEILTIEELMLRLREARTGRRGAVVHLPLGLILPPLRLAGVIGLGRVLPVTVGQLSSFRFDGVVAAGDATPRNDAAFSAELDRECRTFTRFLVGVDPSAYVQRTYAEAHRTCPVYSRGDRFDRFAVRFAARHRALARMADAYARLFAPAGLLRQKLVLLLAILETSAPTYRLIDEPVRGSAAVVLTRLALGGIVAIASLAAGAVVLLPMQLLLGSSGRDPA